jgi:hypothetical protein
VHGYRAVSLRSAAGEAHAVVKGLLAELNLIVNETLAKN